MRLSSLPLRWALRRNVSLTPAHASKCRRAFSTAGPRHDRSNSAETGNVDVEKLLSEPTWSIASLLPRPDARPDHAPQLSSKQLHHLLRLSALPPPKDVAEEGALLSTLASQLHFVRQMQSVDTTGVEPLRSLRDETADGEKAETLGLEALQGALDGEEVRGKWHKRIRRPRAERGSGSEYGEWDPLSTAGKKVGRFFVVEGGKEA
ncbi:hypothetical protein LTR08_003706 [Meristemomyces frigidus]|nr:hypothetical protein LTR08_003706 [Meristemomyces frigidus]